MTVEAKFTMRASDETLISLSWARQSCVYEKAPAKVLQTKLQWAMIIRIDGHRILIEGHLQTPLMHLESTSAECHPQQGANRESQSLRCRVAAVPSLLLNVSR